MAISFQVLGAAQRDNALFVRVDSGQAIARLLFDCGERCPTALPISDLLALDHLLFSHQHMDHIAGFDTLFRRIYNRPDRPVEVWGPPGTGTIMHHRFRGFQWNLIEGQPGTWLVHDLAAQRRETWRFEATEGFTTAHALGTQTLDGPCINTPAFTVEALTMNHSTPSLAYVVREQTRVNIDPARLAEWGLRPGAWLQQVKERQADEESDLEIDGVRHRLDALRATLLVETPGESLAYLTDFILDDSARERLLPVIKGCTTLVCESQYLQADQELAVRNYHMTATQVADLARRAGVGQLLLIHVSERYRHDELPVLLAEAQAVFPNTSFPEHWEIGESTFKTSTL